MKNRYSDMEAVVQPVRNSVRLCNLPPNSILFKAAALDREGKSTIRNQLQDREGTIHARFNMTLHSMWEQGTCMPCLYRSILRSKAWPLSMDKTFHLTIGRSPYLL